jgi:hypothetical protein
LKTKIIAISTVGILLIGSVIALLYWIQTPTHSFHQILDALETHDVTQFEQYVDIESVSSRLVDDVMSMALAEDQQKSEAEELGSAFAAGLLQMMKPSLVALIHEQVTRLVENGNFGSVSGQTESDATDVDLGDMAENIGAGADSFQGITYVKKSGKIAHVGLTFSNSELESDIVLELMMRDVGKHWQLAEFSNLVSLLEAISQLEAEKLAEANEPILQELAQTLQVESTKKTTRSDRYGFTKNVDLEVIILNTSEFIVNSFFAVIRLTDGAGEIIKEVSIKDDKSIKPGKTGGGRWSVEVNMFDSSENRLYEIPGSEVYFEVIFKEIVFENGRVLRMFESIDEVNS